MHFHSTAGAGCDGLRLADDDGALALDLPPPPLPPAPWRVEASRRAAAQTPGGFPLYL